MFYSYEILTQREHGIATIWLVATLGSTTRGKRVNKKNILDVNIPKACENVTSPKAPMALRLQSNLLVGISRVYLSKHDYLHTDAQALDRNMRLFLKIAQSSNTDPDAGRTKPDQLLLDDDQAFMPDVFPDFSLDLRTISHVTHSHSETIISSAKQHRPSAADSSIFGTVVPVVPPTGSGDTTGRFAVSRSNYQTEQPMLTLDDKLAFLPDVGFEFDADGNLVDTESQPIITSGSGEAGSRSETFEYNLDLCDDVAAAHYDEQRPASGRPSRQDDEDGDIRQAEEEPEHDLTVAKALHQCGRRPLPTDIHSQEIRSVELQRWQTNYLINMLVARKQKQLKRRPIWAKRFAARCVWGNGLAGLGLEGRIMQNRGPLVMFAGQRLRDMVFGDLQKHEAGRKRGLDASHSNDERRVKRKINLEQTSQRDPENLAQEQEIEIGRAAPSGLDEFSSQMPWNMLSSAAGSRASSIRPPSRMGSGIFGSARRPAIYSAGTVLSSSNPRAPFSRRSPSLALSASSLQQDGNKTSPMDFGHEVLAGSHSEDDALREFELYGPGAIVDTQTATQREWLHGTLQVEEGNFLGFVKTKMENLATDVVSFKRLLPPEENTKIVAAQGFMHVLALIGKGLLRAQQQDIFAAPILVRVKEL